MTTTPITARAKKVRSALVIEDDADFGRQLTTLLREKLKFPRVAWAKSIKEAKACLQDESARFVEVIFFDLVLQRLDRGREITAIRELAPGAKVIVLTAYDEPERIFRALCAGADSYLLKFDEVRPLERSIRQAIQQENIFSPAIADRVLQHFHAMGRHERSAGFERLSEQEQQVLLLLRAGFTDKEIAQKLGNLAPKTIKNHSQAIRRKLRVSNRTKAAVLAQLFPSWLFRK